MSTFFRLDDGRLQALEAALASSIPLDVLERGFDYYRREKVLSIQVMESSSIYGVVKGTAIYAVTLDSDDFGYSTCTCPAKGYCKHMAAVFYAYYAYAGLSPDEVHNRLLYGDVLALAESPAKRGVEKNAASTDGAGPRPGQWLLEMEAKHGETWRLCGHSLHPLQSVLTAVKAISKSWSEGMRRLHWMHGIIFVLEQAERAYSNTDSFKRYYSEMAFTRMTEPWLNQYYELAGEIAPAALTQEERAGLNSLIAVFHDREMDRELQLHRWEMLYFSLWSSLIEDERLREQEEAYLTEQLHQAGSKAHIGFFMPMALAYLAFADGRDGEAIELLSRTAFNRTALLACDCALQRLEDRNWSKLEDWIGYLFSGLSVERKSKAFGPFLTMCRLADRQQPDNPRWQTYLVSFLPYSYASLTEHWLDIQQYTKWADLQLLFGIEPDDIDVQLMREISKAAPQVLYPIYHQAIDGAIRSRNRQGYRQAVKLMKRLEKLYKAEKQSEAWSRFVDGIVRKHQRLRALQEELWRGKIIT
ncbi:SWIM zinc finger domain-containing protein [Paenibacillus sp. R14(2021)]|uniref:SWIM zinc finger family protein n=1 Tax=Paenibacillus sp. R14(2021) TaxID=2859228 RepID=UPI001C611791|nr:SWIM zinc finger family protein [Paenibacillus sp. R14(2021)]